MKRKALGLKAGQLFILLAAIVATFIPVLLIQAHVLNYTNGVFCYPLDDTFIHMEVAKNIAYNNTWGINAGEFASVSSSLLYSLLLAAAFKIFSVHILIPLVINSIAAIILLYVLQQRLIRQNIKGAARLLILLLLIFFTPLPILIISGMEHTLQCLFCFLFISSFADWLQKMLETKDRHLKLPAPIFIYGILVTAIRYEGLFLIAVACLVLLYFRKWSSSITLGLISLLPVIIFGLYAISKGSYFLPNSVLIKSDTIHLSAAGIISFVNKVLIDKLTVVMPKIGITALATQRILIILPLAYLVFRKYAGRNSSAIWAILILFFCTLLHLSFAATGWFYRYEAYLILLAMFFISVLAYKYGKAIISGTSKISRALALMLAFFLFFPLLLRSTAGFSKAAQACINIFEQQSQMGHFLKEYYANDNVALNDIGAVSYYKQGQVLDLWGLGNNEIAKSRKENYWTPGFIDSFSKQKNAKVAVIYDSWFSDSLLRKWTKVGSWQIQNNVICGDDVVSFYSIDPSGTAQLKKDLEEYQKQSLPGSIHVNYY